MKAWQALWITALAIGLVMTIPGVSFAADGKKIFKRTCAACHTIGGGRLVGPDLKDVHLRRKNLWLKKFIRSSQKMIKAGDKDAVAIFKKFNKMIMPDQNLSDGEIGALLQYITKAKAAAPKVKWTFTKADVDRGRDLFQGKIRFQNKGPSCIACHNVRNDAIIGGGILAKELTGVFSRLGGALPVRALLGTPPFPVMKRAYHGRPLVTSEIKGLVAFLKHADKFKKLHQPRDYGIKLFIAGATGTALLMSLFFLLWVNRKKKSVYDEIYERQISSTDSY